MYNDNQILFLKIKNTNTVGFTLKKIMLLPDGTSECWNCQITSNPMIHIWKKNDNLTKNATDTLIDLSESIDISDSILTRIIDESNLPVEIRKFKERIDKKCFFY